MLCFLGITGVRGRGPAEWRRRALLLCCGSAWRPARCQAWGYIGRRRGRRGFGRGGARVFARAWSRRRQPRRRLCQARRAADSWAWVAFGSSSPAGGLSKSQKARRVRGNAGCYHPRRAISSDVRAVVVLGWPFERSQTSAKTPSCDPTCEQKGET